MRTVTFVSVLNAVARRAGLDPTTWSAGNQTSALEFINAWVKKAWEWEFFAEWTVLEQRAYRDAYNAATNYPAPTATVPQEVWFPASQRYYQALQATVGHDPATLVNGIWTANAPYWADSVMGYSYGVPYGQVVPAPYYGSDWAPNTNYTAGPGTVVRNPGDNRFYQCILDHVSGANFDPTKWGILTTFERYVALNQTGMTPIGEVRQVTTNNPRTSPRYPGPLTFIIDDRGILPAPRAGVQVWVEFRKRPPVFTLTAWNNGVTYGLGDVIYDATSGECFASQQAGNLNHAINLPAWWLKVDMPYILAEPVKWGAYADILRMDGKTVEAARAEQEFFSQLSQVSDVALASQAQYDRAAVQAY